MGGILQLKRGNEIVLPTLAGVQILEGDRFSLDQVFRGGMGICLKVRHIGTNRPFAVKCIQPEIIPNNAYWSRFIQELQWWLTLSSHEGVAEAFCIERIDEMPVMCAAWQQGGNLRAHLFTSNVDFTFTTILRTIRTLMWVHQKHRVIHRDLKPENILLDENHRSYISDWGLIKALDRISESGDVPKKSSWSSSLHLTEIGQILGTTLYASPEQLLGLTAVDHRSDIYSLGCMLFEWETGRPPFIGRSHEEIVEQQIHRSPPKLETFAVRRQLGIDSIISRCLEKDPKNRFFHYQELEDQVLRVAERHKLNLKGMEMRQRSERLRFDSTAGINSEKGLIRSPQGYAWIDAKLAKKYLDHAFAEAGLGNYSKAAEILAPFYIEQLCREVTSWNMCHRIGLNYGLFLTQSGQQQDAGRVYEVLACIYEKPAEFYVNYSLTLIRLNRFSEAEALARSGLEEFPSDCDLLGNLSIALHNQKRLDEAIAVSSQRLLIRKDIHALEEIGQLWLTKGLGIIEEWRECISYLNKALSYLLEAKALNPRYGVARFALAQVLFTMERYSEAMDECVAISKITDDRSIVDSATCLMAEILEASIGPQECLEFGKKWKDRLKHPIAIESMDRILMQALVDSRMIGLELDGKRVAIPEVIDWYRRAVVEKPNPMAVDMLYFARICEWMDSVEMAFDYLDRVEAPKPKWWKTSYYRAQILFREGARDEAYRQGYAAVALAPFRPEPIHQIAFFLRQSGDEAMAKQKESEAATVGKLRAQVSKS